MSRDETAESEAGRLLIPGRPPASSPGGAGLAWLRRRGSGPGAPALVFCHGFRSAKAGEKAEALDRLAARTGLGLLRFDLSGHGESAGEFRDGTIGQWRDDLLAVIDRLAEGPVILVGSSLGGWLSLLAALARPERVAGLVLVAPAPDFTQRLVWQRMDGETRARFLRDGAWWHRPADEDSPYPITRRLVEEGRAHLLLTGGRIAVRCPVRLLHGMADPDVPWRQSLELAEALEAADVRLTLVKDGDHRLSRPQDLALLEAAALELAGLA